MSASEPSSPGDDWIEVTPHKWKRRYACSAEEVAIAEELEGARAAERENEFAALLRVMVGHLMDAYGVEAVADLPHARELVLRAVEECAIEKGISYEVAAEIAGRDLGFPESDA